MRKVLLLLLVCVSGYVRAQETPRLKTPVNYSQPFARGSGLIGLQAGYSQGVWFGRNLTIHPYGGYFVANKLLLGVTGTISQEGFDRVREIINSVGPMIRYQITRTRLSPFLTASCQIGQRTLSGADSRTTTQTQVVGGQVITSTSGSYVFSDGIPHLIYTRSMGAGLSMGVSRALWIDLAVTSQDQAVSPGSKIDSYTILWQLQAGLNYKLGGR
ncbi:hypothetical protein [Spirosoma foliorum]|uniref:Outer membrane protein beta-barrel domain-containing protein n=1 Tax=Spirosoma foliorum TaxID=2710596 RepID=A0A7G5H280_9BACT|nr:hypothetical protein [Spirosoma foliorum]QMW05222.1 hypothetical protein H3H32_10200 [Spirosoma foliorum]